MDVANAQEHVPEIERSHQVIKERARAMFHRLPYQALPKLALKILVLDSTMKLNFFPPKGGISSTLSPRMILHKVNLDYTKHCAIHFGSYVQALDDPPPAKKNTLAPRAIDGFYIRYQDSSQGGHQILDLRTQLVITRQTVQIIPVTSRVVQLVHDIAKQDRMPEGLKIATKTGTILYDSTLIAGVDYVPQNFPQGPQSVQDSDGDDTSEDETYTQSTETTADSEEDLDYRSETSTPQGDHDNQPEIEANDVEVEEDNQSGMEATITRSGRTVTPPERLNLYQQQIRGRSYKRDSG
jgi:hypothetical protein